MSVFDDMGVSLHIWHIGSYINTSGTFLCEHIFFSLKNFKKKNDYLKTPFLQKQTPCFSPFLSSPPSVSFFFLLCLNGGLLRGHMYAVVMDDYAEAWSVVFFVHWSFLSAIFVILKAIRLKKRWLRSYSHCYCSTICVCLPVLTVGLHRIWKYLYV